MGWKGLKAVAVRGDERLLTLPPGGGEGEGEGDSGMQKSAFIGDANTERVLLSRRPWAGGWLPPGAGSPRRPSPGHEEVVDGAGEDGAVGDGGHVYGREVPVSRRVGAASGAVEGRRCC